MAGVFHAVGGDDDAHGGMIGDDLPRADLRSFRHGDLVVVPRRHHHTRRQILKLSHRAGHHVPHAVDHPHGKADAFVKMYLYRFFWNEFWLRRHDGAPRSALGQLVGGSVPAVHVVNMGDHLRFHKPLDKGRFSGSDRPYNADINAVLGSCRHVLIDACGLIHSTALRCWFYFMSMWPCPVLCKKFLTILSKPVEYQPGCMVKYTMQIVYSIEGSADYAGRKR